MLHNVIFNVFGKNLKPVKSQFLPMLIWLFLVTTESSKPLTSINKEPTGTRNLTRKYQIYRMLIEGKLNL